MKWLGYFSVFPGTYTALIVGSSHFLAGLTKLLMINIVLIEKYIGCTYQSK